MPFCCESDGGSDACRQQQHAQRTMHHSTQPRVSSVHTRCKTPLFATLRVDEVCMCVHAAARLEAAQSVQSCRSGSSHNSAERGTAEKLFLSARPLCNTSSSTHTQRALYMEGRSCRQHALLTAVSSDARMMQLQRAASAPSSESVLATQRMLHRHACMRARASCASVIFTHLAMRACTCRGVNRWVRVCVVWCAV